MRCKICCKSELVNLRRISFNSRKSRHISTFFKFDMRDTVACHPCYIKLVNVIEVLTKYYRRRQRNARVSRLIDTSDNDCYFCKSIQSLRVCHTISIKYMNYIHQKLLRRKMRCVHFLTCSDCYKVINKINGLLCLYYTYRLLPLRHSGLSDVSSSEIDDTSSD